MKKILIGLGVVVVLLVGAAFIAPMLIPLDTYKAQIATQVEEATGRKFQIAGDVKLSILPQLIVEAEKVSLANAPGAKTPNMVELSRLQIKLALLPLLSREVVVDRFVLVDPVINLEVARDGRPNWALGAAATGTATGSAAKPKMEKSDGDAAAGIGGIKLDDVRLVNGRVTFNDRKSGKTEVISDINMTVSLPDIASKLQADGKLSWNRETLEIKLNVDTPELLLAGKPARIEATLASKPIRLSYIGSLTSAKALAAAGKVDLDIPSVRQLAAWAGQPLKAGGTGFGPLSIKGDLKMAGPRIAFENADLRFDEIKGKGLFRVETGGVRPAITARLSLGVLDLNPYLPPSDAAGDKSKPAASNRPAAKPAADQGWSDEPIDLSALKTVDATLGLRVEGIAAQKIKIGKTTLNVLLKSGRLTADLSEMALYGGKGKALIKVDGAARVPTVSESFELVGIKAAPFLADAAGFDRIEGTANAVMAVTTRGRSQKEMVSALNGTGKVTFLNGAIRGINLAAMARNITTAFADAQAGQTEKTDFAELSGSYKITRGTVANKDLLLKSPLLRVNGAGTVELPRKFVNYRVTPKIVGSLKGQGGKADRGGFTIPVVVKGPWDRLSYKPDLAGAATDKLKQIKDPESALKVLEGLKKGDGSGGFGKPKDVLKRLFR